MHSAAENIKTSLNAFHTQSRSSESKKCQGFAPVYLQIFLIYVEDFVTFLRTIFCATVQVLSFSLHWQYPVCADVLWSLCSGTGL